jgi:hypothetical protein
MILKKDIIFRLLSIKHPKKEEARWFATRGTKAQTIIRELSIRPTSEASIGAPSL